MFDYTLTRRAALGALAASATLAASTRAAGSSGATTVIPVNAATVAIEGRTATGPDGALLIGFPGVVLHFACDGPATLMLTASSSECYIDITVDGAPPRMVHLVAGPQAVPLTDAPGPHRIAVLKRTESWQGQLAVASIDGPRRVTPLALPARRVMFIGDSITCGAASDVPDAASLLEGTVINNAAKSFGRVLAASLNATCHLVSYGGRGVIRDWQGIRAINNAPQFYEQAMPDDAMSRWDHRRYVPDAIGICLGTNDFNQGVPDQNEFVNGYVEFLRKLRRDAPAAAIFVIDSPMTDDSPELGHRRTIQRDYLDEVVRRNGDARVMRAALPHYPARPKNSHPIASEHVLIAAELEPHIRAATGWRA